jgi:hypothetical protein
MRAHRHQDDGRAITTAIARAHLPVREVAFTRRTQIEWACRAVAVEYATRNTTHPESPYRIRED